MLAHLRVLLRWPAQQVAALQSIFPSRENRGAQVDQVDEQIRAPCAVVLFEFEDYPEPKILSPKQLRALYEHYKSYYRVGDAIGSSEGFARQTAKKR